MSATTVAAVTSAAAAMSAMKRGRSSPYLGGEARY